MNQSRLYKIILKIIYINLFLSIAYSIVHKPIGDEKKIKLKIGSKERSYYEVDKDGLLYKSVGKQFENRDSIRIGIYSRSIKAPSGKKEKNFGFSIQIDNGPIKKLKYKKSGSTVTSNDRPGWNYTESGTWFIYLPFKKNGYNIKIKPLKKGSIVYTRIISKNLQKEGSYSKAIKTINQQDRWRIQTKNNDNSISTTYWYPLKVDDYQQYEVDGPALLRIFTRIQTSINLNNEEYYLRIREDGYDLGTIYFQSELSELSSIVKNGEPLTKWRSTWLNVPSGKHYYTFTSPNINNNHSKNIFVRIKKWESQK